MNELHGTTSRYCHQILRILAVSWPTTDYQRYVGWDGRNQAIDSFVR